jgi:hypothetical protein
MALTKTITKKSVKYGQEKLNIITFNLSLLDNAVEVLNQDFSVEFRLGDNVADKVAKVTELMQIAIDRYKAEQIIFNSTALNDAVTNISNGVIL